MDCKFLVLLFIFLLQRTINGSIIRKNSQRRFMWKQMDETVDDLVEGVASGARTIKHMFGDSMQGSKNGVVPKRYKNIMDYLPVASTRVKYIIRKPIVKPIQIVKKIYLPQSSVKVITVSKPIVQFPSSEEMRKLEKEQEIMTEYGTEVQVQPDTSTEISINNFIADVPHTQKPELISANMKTSQINVSADDWLKNDIPVTLAPSAIVRPHALSRLHTSFVGETLPQPEKLVYGRNDSFHQQTEVQENFRESRYEVTENEPGNTVNVPQNHNYYSRTMERANRGIDHERIQMERSSNKETPSSAQRFLPSESLAEASWLPATPASHFIQKSKRDRKYTTVKPKAQLSKQTQETLKTILKSSTTTSGASLREEPTSIHPESTTLNGAKKMPRNIQQRGSVKYGDKLRYHEADKENRQGS